MTRTLTAAIFIGLMYSVGLTQGKAGKDGDARSEFSTTSALRKENERYKSELQAGEGYQRTANAIYARLSGNVSFQLLDATYSVRDTAIKGYKVMGIDISYNLRIPAELALDRIPSMGRYLEGVLLRGRLTIDNNGEIGRSYTVLTDSIKSFPIIYRSFFKFNHIPSLCVAQGRCGLQIDVVGYIHGHIGAWDKKNGYICVSQDRETDEAWRTAAFDTSLTSGRTATEHRCKMMLYNGGRDYLVDEKGFGYYMDGRVKSFLDSVYKDEK